MKYIEIALGTFTNRGIIIPEVEIFDYINKAQKLNLPLFKSYFHFGEDLLKHSGKTIKGYPGLAYVNTIIFDIDKHSDKDVILHLRAKEFVQRLAENWDLDETTILPSFSGTGFHIEIPDIFQFQPSEDIEIVRSTLSHYFPEADIIYDKARLIRVQGTINQKSGLYKIPLTYHELFELPIDEILEMAKTPRLDFVKEMGTPTYFPELKIQVKKKELPAASKDDTTKIITCMQKLFNRGAQPGSRHTDMLRLVSSWRRSGIPYDGILAMLEKWAPDMEPAELIQITDGVFKNKYQYSCKDSVFQKYCDPKCIYYNSKNYSLEIHDSKSLEKSYSAFMRKDFSSQSFNFADIYDLEHDFLVRPGELITIIGETKLGKSALVQNWCYAIKMPILYLSLEMHERLTFRRFIQIAHGMSKEEVEAHYKVADNSLSNAISHIKIMSIAPSLDNIRKVINDAEAKVVIVDVLDAIEVKGYQDEGKVGIIGTELKVLAQELDIIIIAIHHISKVASMGGSLNIHSGKGSSSIEQKSDAIVAIEGSPSKPYRKISILGARDNTPFSIVAQMSGKTFRFRQIPKEDLGGN